MDNPRISSYFVSILIVAVIGIGFADSVYAATTDKPRVIATTDGEIDDQCSMVRFLLYANEWDIEGIITSSSQYHWRGHRWAGDDWIEPYLDAYEKVYPNLVKHDPEYPTPQYLRDRHVLGNVDAEGEMDKVTPGSELIVQVLLDETDDRPVWLQAWGGPNTIARALKTIEERHPEKVASVAKKIRLFLIWEQDDSYQKYIRPHWERYNILSIISDQFDAIAYQWHEIIPEKENQYYRASWMKENILNNHGPLCSLYRAKENGDFRSEGDSPSFMHCIGTGLRNMENPGWGGWGGRYVRVRNNTWLDPIVGDRFTYPEGRWYSKVTLGRKLRASKDPADKIVMQQYYRPMWRWSIAFQNDWAARADWCVKSPSQANHPPKVALEHSADLAAAPGATLNLIAHADDPDGDALSYRWWQYQEAGTYKGKIAIKNATSKSASVTLPSDAKSSQTAHFICEVADDGSPPLTRYQRVVITIE
ncbi:MAG: DUF1593 domain-containing protein [Sedimentisphaerales bacterium]|nr:DUF1593 domain-containing protein [Sedimentisphaerales bacterium]